MTDFEELDRLSSDELRHRAVRLAEERLDVRFFWRLLKTIPEAEAASGNPEEGQQDVRRASALLYDFIRRDERVDDALRPLYIEYLLAHEHQG